MPDVRCGRLMCGRPDCWACCVLRSTGSPLVTNVCLSALCSGPLASPHWLYVEVPQLLMRPP